MNAKSARVNDAYLQTVVLACGGVDSQTIAILEANGFTDVSQFAGYTVEDFLAMSYIDPVHKSAVVMGYRFAKALCDAFSEIGEKQLILRYQDTVFSNSIKLERGYNWPGYHRRR